MKSKIRLALAVALAASAAPALAQFTQTATANFSVSANVQRTCRFGTVNALAFPGTYDALGAAVTGQTTFQIRCNRGTAYAVAIENGSNFGQATGLGTDRAMRGDTATGEYLAYRLFRDAALTQAWGNTIGTNTSDSTGVANSAPIYLTVYGQIPAGQDVSAQGYTDANVQITIHY
jgi:spore coat protein U-like protein